MEDGRFISNYLPNGLFEQNFQKTKNIKSNEDYRKYLTNNAQKIMNHNKQQVLHENVNMTFYSSLNKNNGPFLFDTFSKNQLPQGYETNKTKQKYLSRQVLHNLHFKK